MTSDARQTMTLADPFIAELQQEAGATRVMLERVPEDKLDWSPHAKSMTLGQLALHVATLPQTMCALMEGEGLDAQDADFNAEQPTSKAQILAGLDASIEVTARTLSAMGDELATQTFTLKNGGAEIFTVPKIGMARSFLFNHWYHHRGQLSVYLRLLDVPVPVVYGRTADENPFAM